MLRMWHALHGIGMGMYSSPPPARIMQCTGQAPLTQKPVWTGLCSSLSLFFVFFEKQEFDLYTEHPSL